jgi:hypothetical protein
MLKATDRAIAVAVRSHRFLFIAATAILAVGTSRIADAADEWGSWIFTVGSAVLMYVSDLCGEIDRKSAELAQSTSQPAAKARVDVFRSDAPKGTYGALILGAVLIPAGFVVNALCS